MFSGIVEEAARVHALTRQAGGARLVVESKLDHAHTGIGDSIAIDGVCLTVVARENGRLQFDLAQETLRRSTLGDLCAGQLVNLERSLVVGQRLHGHFVFGHVDTTVALRSQSNEGNSIRMLFEVPAEYRCYLSSKGSVALAGVSLTVGEIESNSFCVYLVPHTLAVTSLSKLKIGSRVNLEIDMLARYVRTLLQTDRVEQPSASSDQRLNALLER